MTQELIDNLIQSGKAKSTELAAEQALFCLGDKCEHFVIVRKGTVRLLYRIQDGQSCVMTTSCLLGNSLYFAQALSETRIELVLITQATFNEQLLASPAFRNFVFSGFHQRFSELMNRTAELVTNTVDQRLAATLLVHLENSDAGTTIDQTHQQLAIDIGSAREVVSRRLNSFEKSGIIAKSRGHIAILNVEKLRAMLFK